MLFYLQQKIHVYTLLVLVIGPNLNSADGTRITFNIPAPHSHGVPFFEGEKFRSSSGGSVLARTSVLVGVGLHGAILGVRTGHRGLGNVLQHPTVALILPNLET